MLPSPSRQDGSDTALIQIEDVAKSYGHVTALEGVCLTVAPGEFFCLLGPSGCGKTTLLRMIAGFEHPDRGRILLDGADLAGTPPHRRPVNMMFQSYALFPHLTVADNVAFGLKQERLPRADRTARVAEMLALVRLSGLEERYPRQLSGGQSQRVALARALAKRPRLLLLDEPLAALDRQLREETRHELKEIQRRLGTAFVVVTHDQDEAMALADRMAIFERGRIAQIGTPRAVYERPASRFVAGFIGDVTLIEGRILSLEADEVTVTSGDCAAPLRVAAGSEAGQGPWQAGQPVVVALRPQAIAVVADTGEGENRLVGTVADSIYRGDLSQIRVRLASGTLVRAAAIDRPGGAPAPEVGARVVLGFAPGAGTLLPP